MEGAQRKRSHFVGLPLGVIGCHRQWESSFLRKVSTNERRVTLAASCVANVPGTVSSVLWKVYSSGYWKICKELNQKTSNRLKSKVLLPECLETWFQSLPLLTRKDIMPLTKTGKKYYIIDVTTNAPHTAKALENQKTSKHLDVLLRDDCYI